MGTRKFSRACAVLLAVGVLRMLSGNVSALAPAPDPDRLAREEVLPLDKARLYNEWAKNQILKANVGELSAGAVVVLPALAESADALGEAIRAAFARSQKGKLSCVAGKTAWLFAQGPSLNGPDKTTIKRLTRKGHKLTLEIEHTDVIVEGAQFRRNIAHTPLVAMPLDLPVGDYKFEVVWKVIASEFPFPHKERIQTLKPLVGTLELLITKE